MEYSSPLAALRPQQVHSWGRKDLPMARSVYYGCPTYGPSSFDFKTMSMQQKPAPRGDYFTLRPTRGSSPTSSLTADLDANFHIDKSPQAPTPRRSLFTTDLFKPRDDAGRLATPPIEIERATTPPIVSSSPGHDAMDISPLPHKAPYFQVTLPSPSPDEIPNEENLVTSDLLSPDELTPLPLQALPQALPVQPPSLLQLPERKRPSTRPGLSRSKGYSTSYVPQRPFTADTHTQLPPFLFGNVLSNGISCSSTPSLLESFVESPVEDVKAQGAASMLPPPRRTSLSAGSRATGSPSAGHVRKSSAGKPTFVRPQRKVMRRSLSMFQHPNDVMKEEQEAFEPQPALASVMDMDVDEDQDLKLPYFTPEHEPDSLPRITQETMADVLESKYDKHYDQIRIIDCRFEYEYNGGHIEGAVNFNDKQLLANELFTNPPTSSTLLIFHCEYSVHRAPLTAKFIRGYDRTENAACYPRLTYPEMYILDGGYSKFFAGYRSKCFPQNYVEMNDQRHEQACERGMAKVKQQRQKLFRNQTFAFGQNGSDDMQDSPTGQGRSIMGARSQSTFNVGVDLAEGIGLSFQRRMASY